MSFAHVACQCTMKEIAQFESKADVGDNIERVHWNNVSIMSVLGQGSFSSVFQVSLSKNPEDDDPVNDDCHNNSGSETSFALKCLKAKRFDTKESFVLGVLDLTCEANILSKLNHKNIIQLRGVSSLSVSDSYAQDDGVGYFIILGILDETLEKRMNFWRQTEPSYPFFTVGRKRKAWVSNMKDRIESVALGITHAMAYLHERRIVLRDLKPENIGFDSQGTVKLFDFGFARNVDTDLEEDDIAGTFRYMAPETMMGERSGLPCDVYSFGVLLWEICSLSRPFELQMDVEEIKKRIINNTAKLPLSAVPSKSVQRVIRGCCDLCPTARPQFTEVTKMLNQICNTRCNESETKQICDRLSLSPRPLGSPKVRRVSETKFRNSDSTRSVDSTTYYDD